MTEAEASSLEMLRKQMQYPLIKARALTCGATPRLATPSITVRCARQNCDMPEEMRQDCVDLVITAIERFQGNYESAARLVKETMDKKYNESWVVVIGEGFTFEVTHEARGRRGPPRGGTGPRGGPTLPR